MNLMVTDPVELGMIVGNWLPQKLPIATESSSWPFSIVKWSLTQLVEFSIDIPLNFSLILLYCDGKSMIHVQLELGAYLEAGKPAVPM